MCGLLFYRSKKAYLDESRFNIALDSIKWRGPDASGTFYDQSNNTFLGHVRLSILDIDSRSNQPFFSEDSAWCIIFNGEIYNHNLLREKYLLSCKTSCDTETVLRGFIAYGIDFINALDGMYSLIIYDLKNKDVFFARDPFGIKPLFIYQMSDTLIVSSETIAIRKLVETTISEESLKEWRLIRSPMPGFTFFNEITEITPGAIYKNGKIICFSNFYDDRPFTVFNQNRFEDLIEKSIIDHELSDAGVVTLISSGLDSGIITNLSSAKRAYSIGYYQNNEFQGAADTCSIARKELVCNIISTDSVPNIWAHLIDLKGEPLYVPNEALIYKLCSLLTCTEKVLLTGEGADELLFGYDNLFRAAANDKFNNLDHFLDEYGYSDISNCTDRLREYLMPKWVNLTQVDFLEDFFLQIHLPCLLRRMDFASMAASKEARVPFVCKSIISYMYRQPFGIRLGDRSSKLPFRELSHRIGMHGALSTKKLGFSASTKVDASRKEEYLEFQNFNLRHLGW